MPSTLIDSQFATLESPTGEPLVLTLDATKMDIDELANAAVVWWDKHKVPATS